MDEMRQTIDDERLKREREKKELKKGIKKSERTTRRMCLK